MAKIVKKLLKLGIAKIAKNCQKIAKKNLTKQKKIKIEKSIFYKKKLLKFVTLKSWETIKICQ